MRDSNLPEPGQPEPELLKIVLQPLLEDFQYWFARSIDLLEKEQLSFMSLEAKSELLKRVKNAREEVNTAKMMFSATGGQVGIEMETLMPWHQLVTECWKVGMRFRQGRET